MHMNWTFYPKITLDDNILRTRYLRSFYFIDTSRNVIDHSKNVWLNMFHKKSWKIKIFLGKELVHHFLMNFVKISFLSPIVKLTLLTIMLMIENNAFFSESCQKKVKSLCRIIFYFFVRKCIGTFDIYLDWFFMIYSKQIVLILLFILYKMIFHWITLNKR